MPNKKTYLSVIKFFILFVSVFMAAEAVVHLSGLRLWGAENVWPVSALLYSQFFMVLWGAISILVAAILFEVHKDVLYYHSILKILAYYCLFHGLLLWYLSLTHYTEILPIPALYVWNPYYSLQLKIEGSMLLLFWFLYMWGKSKGFLGK